MIEKEVNKILKDIGARYTTLHIRSMMQEAITCKEFVRPLSILEKVTNNGELQFNSDKQLQILIDWFMVTWNQIAELVGPLSKN